LKRVSCDLRPAAFREQDIERFEEKLLLRLFIMESDLFELVGHQRVNPYRDRGPTLRWRIEIAAAFLASAIDHAISAAEANDANCEYMMDLAIDLTVRRAQEIFGQGGA
jgi:hypothetical protein